MHGYEKRQQIFQYFDRHGSQHGKNLFCELKRLRNRNYTRGSNVIFFLHKVKTVVCH